MTHLESQLLHERTAATPTTTSPAADLRRRMRDFYRGRTWDEQRHDASYYRRWLGTLQRFVPPVDSVLDVGVGLGAALARFADQRRPSRAVGLDVADAALRRVEARGLRAVGGDGLALPFADSTFELVMAYEVVEHLPDVELAVTEWLRVLSRPGYLALGLPNHASLSTPLQDLLLRRTRHAFGVTGRADALRWLGRNLAMAPGKRFGPPRYRYREPDLSDGSAGGDVDAVYYCCPLDLRRALRRRGVRLVGTDAEVRWGGWGRLVPLELRGSAILVWRVGA